MYLMSSFIYQYIEIIAKIISVKVPFEVEHKSSLLQETFFRALLVFLWASVISQMEFLHQFLQYKSSSEKEQCAETTCAWSMVTPSHFLHLWLSSP